MKKKQLTCSKSNQDLHSSTVTKINGKNYVCNEQFKADLLCCAAQKTTTHSPQNRRRQPIIRERKKYLTFRI